MVTIHDLARQSGYSSATVSKALNNRYGVSKKAKKEIQALAKKLHYTPNLSARMLQTKKSYMVGVLLHTDSRGIFHPHFSEVLNSFKIEMEYAGYDILFIGNKVGGSIITYQEHCAVRGLDGVLLAIPEYTEKNRNEQITELLQSSIPKILVENDNKNHSAVYSDNETGAYEIVQYVYALGHRQISCICTQSDQLANVQRKNGYLRLMAEKLLEPQILYSDGFTYEAGLQMGDKLLSMGKENMPTACFCISDSIALGIMEKMREAGITVPQHISIAGFDNLPVAQFLGLTTVTQDRSLIGIRAAQKLIKLIQEEEEPDPETIIVNTQLKIRSSCGIPRGL